MKFDTAHEGEEEEEVKGKEQGVVDIIKLKLNFAINEVCADI